MEKHLPTNALRLLAIGSTIAVLLAGCGPQDADDTLTASGFIEAEEVVVAPEIAGRIAQIEVGRGDEVSAGQVLIEMDDDALQSQLGEAEARLSTAQASFDRLVAGARAEAFDAAEARLAQARAEQDGAAQSVINARDAISRPLSLNAEVDGARTQVRLAEQNLELAEANLAETRLRHGVYAVKGGDTKRTWDLQLRAAEASVAEAEAQLTGARQYLGLLLTKRADPLTLEAELHTAETELQSAGAEVDAAEAELDELRAGPTAEAIAVAQARVHQAQAGVRVLEARIDQLTLRAPMSGTVSKRTAHVGETATAGAPLLTITSLDEVTLVIYIPENRLGLVTIGQTVEVMVDSFPGRIFRGHVASIAGEAEFTPRNVQTEEERVNLVFAVDVSIPNPDHALKAGMPADATIRP